MKQPDELWWQLERERMDRSYLNVKPTFDAHQPKFAPVMNKKERKVWFDAGRFNAGARDAAAEKGHSEAMRIAGQLNGNLLGDKK